VEGAGEGALQPEGQGRGLGGVAVAGEDEELVGAQPPHGVPRADLLGEPAADLAQQLVADLVAEGVVDGLEPVEVEEEQRRPAGAVLQRLADELQQPRAVGQAGEVVVAGPPGQRLLVADPLGDVGEGDDDPA
jgi:nucleotide-binding universal stress UspA family protein